MNKIKTHVGKRTSAAICAAAFLLSGLDQARAGLGDFIEGGKDIVGGVLDGVVDIATDSVKGAVSGLSESVIGGLASGLAEATGISKKHGGNDITGTVELHSDVEIDRVNGTAAIIEAGDITLHDVSAQAVTAESKVRVKEINATAAAVFLGNITADGVDSSGSLSFKTDVEADQINATAALVEAGNISMTDSSVGSANVTTHVKLGTATVTGGVLRLGNVRN